MTLYTVVEAPTSYLLSGMVEERLKLGWSLAGGVSLAYYAELVHSGGEDRDEVFATYSQAMTKEEP